MNSWLKSAILFFFVRGKNVCGCWFVLLLGVGLGANTVNAQVISDTTLSTKITSTDNLNFVIEDGDRAGNNLFHSFDQFSIPTNGSAVFQDAAGIENIFSRVTGNRVSTIDGLIQANASLFLLNPNGILFGPNARLDLGGSFLGSTANSISFDNNLSFSATDTTAIPLLSINSPIGLQMGSSPGEIQVNGAGHNLSVDDVAFNNQFRTFAPLVTPDRTARPVGLQVPSGYTLALVGGDITLSGGNLSAFGGRVELGSVAAPGVVDLVAASNGFTFDYSDISTFSDIHLNQAASIDISGVGSGDLQIQGKTIAFTDTSTLLSQTLGTENGGHSLLSASDSILFQGTATADVPTAWFNRVDTNATGSGGTIAIATGNLLIDTNAFISSSTLGSGNAGDVSVRATTLETTKPFELLLAKPTGIFSTVFPDATGIGGTLDLQTDRLQMENVTNIQAIVLGAGNGGDLKLRGQTAVVSDLAALQALSFGIGNGGDLSIQVERLQALNGGQIATTTFADGDGGRLNIQTVDTEIVGAYNLSLVGGFISSGLFTGNQPGSTGNSNTLTIDTQRLHVADGGTIFSGVLGTGNGADIIIRAQDIEVSGTLIDFGPEGAQSGVSTSVNRAGSGPAGNLIINTDRLRVSNGGLISSKTEGSANAGNIQISSNSIEVSGSTVLRSATQEFGITPSQISASSSTEFSAGSIVFQTDDLQVNDGGEITVSNTDNGDAGNLEVDARNIFITEGGSLRAEVNGGAQGNINLSADDLLLLRQGSTITSTATSLSTGGNIDIQASLVVGVPGENSDIIANAVQGDGGNISITTQGLFGLEFRDEQTPDNDITASSQFGVSGKVDINNLIVDPGASLVKLPEALANADEQVAMACASNERNQFIASGRGGLPESPINRLSGTSPWNDMRDLTAFVPSEDNGLPVNEATLDLTEEVQGPLEEASGWQVNNNGQVELLTAAHATAAQNLPSGCLIQANAAGV